MTSVKLLLSGGSIFRAAYGFREAMQCEPVKRMSPMFTNPEDHAPTALATEQREAMCLCVSVCVSMCPHSCLHSMTGRWRPIPWTSTAFRHAAQLERPGGEGSFAALLALHARGRPDIHSQFNRAVAENEAAFGFIIIMMIIISINTIIISRLPEGMRATLRLEGTCPPYIWLLGFLASMEGIPCAMFVYQEGPFGP